MKLSYSCLFVLSKKILSPKEMYLNCSVEESILK